MRMSPPAGAAGLTPTSLKYLAALPNTGRGVSDAVNLRYPTLYETGAEKTTLELETPNDPDDQPDWRLHRVNEPTAAALILGLAPCALER